MRSKRGRAHPTSNKTRAPQLMGANSRGRSGFGPFCFGHHRGFVVHSHCLFLLRGWHIFGVLFPMLVRRAGLCGGKQKETCACLTVFGRCFCCCFMFVSIAPSSLWNSIVHRCAKNCQPVRMRTPASGEVASLSEVKVAQMGCGQCRVQVKRTRRNRQIHSLVFERE